MIYIDGATLESAWAPHAFDFVEDNLKTLLEMPSFIKSLHRRADALSRNGLCVLLLLGVLHQNEENPHATYAIIGAYCLSRSIAMIRAARP